jgi:hypothetical protein
MVEENKRFWGKRNGEIEKAKEFDAQVISWSKEQDVYIIVIIIIINYRD